MLVVLAAGLVLAIVLAAMAFTSRASARREAAVSQSLVLAANAADAYEGGEGDLALALALASVTVEDAPSEATRTLADVGFGVGTRAVLEGHSHSVRGAALSPEGDRALSGSCAEITGDGTCTKGELILWDVTTRTEIARLGGHSGWVNDVAFAPDGRTAFSASDDATLASWDVATGEPLKRFTGDPTGLRAVAISADGTTALSGSNGGSLTLWNLATGEPIRTIAGHDGAITRAIFGPVGVAGAAGSTAITASADSSIVLWDLETGKRIRTFAGHSGWVTDVAAHPDGTRIMSTGEDLSLRMWDIESGQQTHEQLFGFDLGSIAITPDGRTAVFSAKTYIYLWGIGRFQEVGGLAGHAVDETQRSSVNAIAISRDGQLALSAGTDGALRIWNLSGQLVSAYFADGGDDIDAIAVSPDGSLLLAGMGKGEHATGELVLWDVDQAEVLRRFGGSDIGITPNCVAFHPAAPRALACAADPSGKSGDTSLILWDIESGEEIRRFEGHASLVRAVAFLPDGETALAGSQSVPDNLVGDLILWDLRTGEKIRTYDVTHDIVDIAVTSDGGRALTGSVTGAAVILWDIETGEQIRRLAGHNLPVINVAFGPEDDIAFASAVDGTVLAWEIETGEIVRRFESNELGGFALDVSPDGRFVMYGSAGGAVTLWDFHTGEISQRFIAHSNWVYDVAFHPDGRRAYTAGVDGRLIEWYNFDLNLEELLNWIEDNRYVRELTCEERTRYHLDPEGCS
jgi:WD40 repeat protein